MPTTTAVLTNMFSGFAGALIVVLISQWLNKRKERRLLYRRLLSELEAVFNSGLGYSTRQGRVPRHQDGRLIPPVKNICLINMVADPTIDIGPMSSKVKNEVSRINARIHSFRSIPRYPTQVDWPEEMTKELGDDFDAALAIREDLKRLTETVAKKLGESPKGRATMMAFDE